MDSGTNVDVRSRSRIIGAVPTSDDMVRVPVTAAWPAAMRRRRAAKRHSARSTQAWQDGEPPFARGLRANGGSL